MEKADKNTIILDKVDSTNNYANRLLRAGKDLDGTVVLAYWQQNGKGHAGNLWESEPQKNLLISYILSPRFLPADKQFYLSKIASLAIFDLLAEETTDLFIKWPNDIYAGDRKMAGILIENSVMGHFLSTSVVGIGLNLNQEKFSSKLPNPVSLKQIAGRDYSVKQVAKRLTTVLRDWYHQLENGQFYVIDMAYYQKLYRLNQWALFKTGDRQFEARIRGVGDIGQIILEKRTGNLEAFLFKEVEYIL